MIRKNYFPTQDAPDWVKNNVMNHINKRGKTFRLFYIMKHKSLAVVFMFIFVIVGSYLYVNNSNINVVTDNNNGNMNINTTRISDWKSNLVLQNKINETESELNDLYDSLSKETIITF